MKKKIIYSSALATLFSASIALAGGPEIIPVEDYFSGFYVGGFGAVHHADFPGSSQIDLTENVPNTDNRPNLQPIFVPGNLVTNQADGESVDGYGGVDGGFGWTFQHRWYLGVFGWGEWGTQTSTDIYNATPVNFDNRHEGRRNRGFADRLDVTNTVTQKISNDYGVGGKFGFNPYPTLLLYGKVAASWAKITVSNSVDATNTFDRPGRSGRFDRDDVHAVTDIDGGSSSDSTKVGLLLGLGAEQFVYRDLVSLFLEWNYVNYGTVDTGPATLTASTSGTNGNNSFGPTPTRDLPITTSASGKARVDTFLGGLNIYFGRHWAIF
ncbi:MAG: hypothetical protein JSR33_07115 [Proteobacteria bacterium]|nr:hypothetical protein [Pseudomonadota bacterium]